MPVHIEQLTSEVAVLDGELPLTEAQVERLVKLVLKRLAEKQRDAAQAATATRLRHRAIPETPFEE